MADYRAYTMYDYPYLAHYGVGHDKGGHSGRYPWGSGKNPSKNRESRSGLSDKQKKIIKIGAAVTATALATYGVYKLKSTGVLDKGKAIVDSFSKKKSLKVSAPKIKRGSEEYNRLKTRALKSGNAEDVLKFRGDLTNDQLREAINRLNYEQQLAALSSKKFISKTSNIGKDKTYAALSAIGDKIAVPIIVGAVSYEIKEFFDKKIENEEEEKNRRELEKLKLELLKNVNPKVKK